MRGYWDARAKSEDSTPTIHELHTTMGRRDLGARHQGIWALRASAATVVVMYTEDGHCRGYTNTISKYEGRAKQILTLLRLSSDEAGTSHDAICCAMRNTVMTGATMLNQPGSR